MMKIKTIFIIILLLISLYFIMFFNINKIQTFLTFPGIRVNVQDVVGHVKTDLSFEEINIKNIDGNNINGLYLTGTKNEIVYYFHGNGGPLSYFYSEIKYINNLGYSVFAYDYPGYGKSTGYPHKELVSQYSKTFFEYIKKEKNIKNENLIIWGYSVGTAVATDFASQNDFKKLVLVSGFTSRYDMGKKYFFSIPPQKLFFLEDSYITKELVKKFNKSALIIHGNKDLIVPFKHGKEVFKNYAGEKYFVEINKTGHNYIIDNFGNELKDIFSSFISGEKMNFDYLFLDGKQKTYYKNGKIINSNEIFEKEQINSSIPTFTPDEKKNNSINFDFKTDDSITKYVSKNISFSKIDYTPKDLELLSGDYIIDIKGNQTLKKEALSNLQKMSKDFYDTFNNKIKIVSAYRSYDYQEGIKNSGCNDIYCAKPGYSEHQTGLAIDLFETTNKDEFLKKNELKKYFEWLTQNAYKYGFHNSYQKGVEIDGYEIEPWHWRYLGVDLSKILFEKNITFGEYYKIVSSQ